LAQRRERERRLARAGAGDSKEVGGPANAKHLECVALPGP